MMEIESLEKMLEEQMREAAAAMDFELAAQLRDQLFEVRARRRRERQDGRVAGCGALADGECRNLTIRRHPAARGRTATSRSMRAELVDWGERFGRAAPAAARRRLTGELGAGKTTLVQAICRGYGVTDDVTSPTFALVHRYSAPRAPVYHLDLYRLRAPRS